MSALDTLTQTDITTILKERGDRYGSFDGHARITQALKQKFVVNAKKYSTMSDSQKEAIDMIFHKIGRIGNGDPNYLDSWVDIVGYAQLVVDELKSQEAAASSGNK